MLRRLLLFVTFLWFLGSNHILKAALVLPKLAFFSDSVLIGKPIQASLVYKHAKNQELLFPDSAYNFYPFEFVKKSYSPTVSDSLWSTDSVVYTLTTFELQKELFLQLPVYVFHNGDTSLIYSEPARVILKELLTPSTPIDSLHVNAQFIAMRSLINYPYIIAFGIGMVLVLLIVLIFFRHQLIRAYRLYFLKKDYEKFVKNYTHIHQRYASNPSVSDLEDLLSVWKKYLQKLEKIPYTTLTTKEISALFDINQLTSSLQNFDRAIYGGIIQSDMENSIQYLKDCARIKFAEKSQELKTHGHRVRR